MDSNLKKGLKIALIFVCALIVIAVNSAVWNSASAGYTDGFIAGLGVINFFAEAYGIWRLGEWLLGERED